MRVSVMITTSNRLEELQRTLQMLGKLDPAPDEVLVTADGCTDGTAEFLSAMPNVKFVGNQPARGSVASRDRMIREARGELVLALDDDSYPEQLDCIARFVPLFEQRSNLAVLHFPQRTDEYPDTVAQMDFGHEKLTRSFANSGAVLHRSTYLELAGFEPRFYHMYEEPDYVLRCTAAGYEAVLSPSVIIRHHFTARSRSEVANHHYHARNEFWSTVMRCPAFFLPSVLMYRVASQFRYACTRGISWMVREPKWWWQAAKGIPRSWRKRRPVSWAAYRRWLSLGC